MKVRSCCLSSSDTLDDYRDETTWPSCRPVRSATPNIVSKPNPHPVFTSDILLFCCFLHLCRLRWRLGRFRSWWFPLAAWRELKSGWSRPVAPSTWSWTHRKRLTFLHSINLTRYVWSHWGRSKRIQNIHSLKTEKFNQVGRRNIFHVWVWYLKTMLVLY